MHDVHHERLQLAQEINGDISILLESSLKLSDQRNAIEREIPIETNMLAEIISQCRSVKTKAIRLVSLAG